MAILFRHPDPFAEEHEAAGKPREGGAEQYSGQK
jgi:hypothetical protein